MSGEAMTSLELQEAAMPSGAGPAEVAAAEEPAAKGEAVEQAPPKEGGTGKEEVTTRERFLELWSGFQVAHGDDTKVPLFNKHEIDLFKLFKVVLKSGGSDAVTATKKWAAVGRNFNPPSSMTDLSTQIKRIYTTKLKSLEEAFYSGSLDFQVPLDGPATPLPPPDTIKAERPPKPKPKAAPKPRPSPQAGEGAAEAPREARRRRAATAPSRSGNLTGEELVGRRVGILWADDAAMYYGKLTAYNSKNGKHWIEYDDGEKDWVELELEEWALEDTPAAAAAAAGGAGGAEPAAAAAGAGAAGEEPGVGQAEGLRAAGAAAGEAGLVAGGALQAQQAQQGGKPPAKRSRAVKQEGGEEGEGPPRKQRQRKAEAGAAGARTPKAKQQAPVPGSDEFTPRHGAARMLLTAANYSPLTPMPPHQQPLQGPAALPAAATASFGAGEVGGLGAGPLPPIPLPPGHRRRAAGEGEEQSAAAGGELIRRDAGPLPQMVAQGRGFQAFTATSGTPGYEIFCLLPGVTINEVHVRCWSNGRVLIRTEPAAQPGAAYSETVILPGLLDTRSAQALFTESGQLYVRVDRK